MDQLFFGYYGLEQTIRGVIDIFDKLSLKNNNFVLFTRNLNQDPLENLFGLVRAQGGNNRILFLIDFLRNISRIMTSKLLIFPNETNCEFDETTFIQTVDLENYNVPAEDIKAKPVYKFSSSAPIGKNGALHRYTNFECIILMGNPFVV